MQLSEKEQLSIDHWAYFHRNGGNVVVTYDTPYEEIESVVFKNVANAQALAQAWDRYCGGDPEVGIIRDVLWCGGVY